MAERILAGRGRMAEVYRVDNDRVIKLFYGWVPDNTVTYEAAVSKAVNEAGVSSPRCYGIETENGRSGIVFEYAPGKTMLDLLTQKPWQVKKFGRQMASLHIGIHKCSSDKLVSAKDKLTGMINASREKLGGTADKLVTAIPITSGQGSICHGDFHPDNIIISSKAIIIDWTNAYTGDPLSDVARTLLMIDSPYMPDGVPAIFKIISRIVRKLLLKTYLKEYIRLSGAKHEAIKAWLPILAAARLTEKIPGEEKWLFSVIKKFQANHPQ